MIHRDITERVPKAAPFLRFDADPYSAVVDGRLVWIWDAYTTTNQYPYSDLVDLAEVRPQPVQERGPGARRERELHPQLGQGRGRRLRRLDDLLRGRPGRSDHPGLGRRVPDAVHAARRTRRTTCSRTSAIRRACSRSRRPSSRTTTSPTRTCSTASRTSGPCRSTRRSRAEERPVPDAPVLRAHAAAGRDRGDVRADPAVHAARPPEHGRVDRGEVRPRPRLRGHRELPVPGRRERRRTDPGLLADQPGRAVLGGADAARPGRLEHRVRRLPRDPASRTRCSTSSRSTWSRTSRTRSPS